MLSPVGRLPKIKVSARSCRDKPYTALKHLGAIRWHHIAAMGMMQTITSNFLLALQHNQKFTETTIKAFTSSCRSKTLHRNLKRRLTKQSQKQHPHAPP